MLVQYTRALLRVLISLASFHSSRNRAGCRHPAHPPEPEHSADPQAHRHLHPRTSGKAARHQRTGVKQHIARHAPLAGWLAAACLYATWSLQ